MKPPLRTLLASSLIAALLLSCSPSGYWVPPSSPPDAVPALSFISETAPPPLPTPTFYNPPTAPATPTTPANPEPQIEPDSPLPSPTPLLAEAPPVLAEATITPQSSEVQTTPILYNAQAADTLPVVAVRFGVEISEITSPEPLPESEFLNPGQLLIIPRRLANTTSSTLLLPDSELVYSPSALDFDIEAYVQQAGGRLSTYREWLKSSGLISGAEVVRRVALENSINPRLLLALIEYHSGWVHGQPQTPDERTYPLGLVDPNQKGLYHQLMWAINQLSVGYYAWREGRLTEIRFKDGVTARLAPDLNAGSAALQYYFAQMVQGQAWLDAVDPEQGFTAVHTRMFGNPWERAQTVEPLFPPGIQQPPMNLPFLKNWLWSFTGGPHGAWEREGAYAALDFAPGSTESGCVKSNAWVTAAASGLVTRSGNGVVILDLDGDGYEQTGWVLFYLHISTNQRAPVGTWVDAGDPLGHPSCEGGLSTGTHIHIARKYNGEWIPAAGPLPFNLSGWVAEAGPVAYKGSLTRDGVTINACTCSSADTLITRRDEDP